MRYFLLVLSICFLLSYKTSFSQNNDSQAFLYNISSSAIIGGIGALINKKKSEKTHNVLFKGIGQGVLGGYLIYGSKKIVRDFSESGNYQLLWPSKLLNFAGNSIVYNAAANRNFWERWHLNLGFNHLIYDFKSEKRFKYRILPFSFAGTISLLVTEKLDLKNSLLTGNFIFETKRVIGDIGASTFANNILYRSDVFNEKILAHELIHIYQYEGFFAINSYFEGSFYESSEKEFWKKYNKIFYTDFNYPFQFSKSRLERLWTNSSLSTPTEQEAYYWTNDYLNIAE